MWLWKSLSETRWSFGQSFCQDSVRPIAGNLYHPSLFPFLFCFFLLRELLWDQKKLLLGHCPPISQRLLISDIVPILHPIFGQYRLKKERQKHHEIISIALVEMGFQSAQCVYSSQRFCTEHIFSLRDNAKRIFCVGFKQSVNPGRLFTKQEVKQSATFDLLFSVSYYYYVLTRNVTLMELSWRFIVWGGRDLGIFLPHRLFLCTPP